MSIIEQKLLLKACLDAMWIAFAANVPVENDADINLFLDAKERAHGILTTLGEPPAPPAEPAEGKKESHDAKEGLRM
jgi:hypothetical protein